MGVPKRDVTRRHVRKECGVERQYFCATCPKHQVQAQGIAENALAVRPRKPFRRLRAGNRRAELVRLADETEYGHVRFYRRQKHCSRAKFHVSTTVRLYFRRTIIACSRTRLDFFLYLACKYRKI